MWIDASAEMTGVNASVEMTGLMWIEASVELPRLWEHLSSRQTHRSLWKHLSFRQTHRSLWKHLSFRPQWRSHEAEKSRGSRAGDLSITSPSVTSVEMTGVNASVEMTRLMWIDASVEKTGSMPQSSCRGLVEITVRQTGLNKGIKRSSCSSHSSWTSWPIETSFSGSSKPMTLLKILGPSSRSIQATT